MTPFTLDLVSSSYTILLYPEPSLFLIPYTKSSECVFVMLVLWYIREPIPIAIHY